MNKLYNSNALGLILSTLLLSACCNNTSINENGPTAKISFKTLNQTVKSNLIKLYPIGGEGVIETQFDQIFTFYLPSAKDEVSYAVEIDGVKDTVTVNYFREFAYTDCKKNITLERRNIKITRNLKNYAFLFKTLN